MENDGPPPPDEPARASPSRIEQSLLAVMEGSESDAARVAAAKALVDLVKYMNGENDRAEQSDDKARMDAIREARELLAEFAKLKFGGAASAGALGLDRADEMVEGGPRGTDHPAG